MMRDTVNDFLIIFPKLECIKIQKSQQETLEFLEIFHYPSMKRRIYVKFLRISSVFCKLSILIQSHKFFDVLLSFILIPR